jgi:hypothetical protein
MPSFRWLSPDPTSGPAPKPNLAVGSASARPVSALRFDELVVAGPIEKPVELDTLLAEVARDCA